MSLTTGDKIGPYEILDALGAGGMGEVYRAKDTKLKREVALKVLPDAFAHDAVRMARFQREAEVLAALNHPNIAQIYGVENHALVMELVEGPTLDARIAERALPLEDALAIAGQIAEALEAAHEKGVVHRDLKPANVKIKPDGVVKVLDFGLATILQNDRSGPTDLSQSPTLSMATQEGVIMGTAPYMSPEQAVGKPVDRRADIWSFGVVLFEMLSGERLFSGETAAHILADVIKGEIALDRLPSSTPRSIRTLLKRCLDRDLKNRLQWIGEARVATTAAMHDVGESPESEAFAPLHSQGRTWGWIVAGVSMLVAAAFGFGWWRSTQPTPQPLVRMAIELGPDVSLPRPDFGSTVILSPDGTRLVYLSGTPARLFIRRLDEIMADAELPGTVGAQHAFFINGGGNWSASNL